jgi:exopolysaccharide biosynthesis polyprenyl glycosylphosphotransferase
MATATKYDISELAGARDQGRTLPRRLTGSGDNLPSGFLWLGDVVLIACALFGTYTLVPELQRLVAPGGALSFVFIAVGVPLSRGTGADLPPLAEMWGVASVMALASLLAVDLLGGYRPLLRQSRTRLALNTVAGPLAGLGATTVILFGLQIFDTSRLFLFTFVALQVVYLATWRLGLRAYKHHRALAGHYARGVLFVGTPAHIRYLANHFRRHVPTHAYHVVGGLPVPDAGGVTTLGAESAPIVSMLGGVDRLGDLLIHRPIDEVVVAQPLGDASWLSRVISQCDYFRVTVRIVPEAILSTELRDLRAAHGADVVGLPALVLTPGRADGHPQFLKRLMDVVVSAVLLLLLAPVFAVIAAAIKLSTPDLPVFYRWRVVGYRGRKFTGYKFTTMDADADERKASLSHLNEMTGPVFKIKADPRVTVLGRFLRKYSLNELPQFWSVLKGDMSLVGPRPAGPHELERYEFWHKRKLSVIPGITCLWQVRGRNKISSFDDWVKMDLEYIDNWSLWLDVKILVRTALVVIRGTGS